MPNDNTCPTCNGSGIEEDGGRRPCPRCYGIGKLNQRGYYANEPRPEPKSREQYRAEALERLKSYRPPATDVSDIIAEY